MGKLTNDFLEKYGTHFNDAGLDFLNGLDFPITESMIRYVDGLEEAFRSIAMAHDDKIEVSYLCHMVVDHFRNLEQAELLEEGDSRCHRYLGAIDRALDGGTFLSGYLCRTNGLKADEFYDTLLGSVESDVISVEEGIYTKFTWTVHTTNFAWPYTATLLRAIWLDKIMEKKNARNPG